MTEARHNPMPAITPRQWAIIGALAVVLVAVIWLQLGGSEQSEGGSGRAPAAGAAPAGRIPAPNSAADEASKRAGESLSASWPAFTLAEVAAYDPFQPFPTRSATPGPAPPAAVKTTGPQDTAQRKARQDQALAALRKTGITAVLRGPQEAMAIVGRRVIRVGDEIDGFRVVAIEPDGVVIKPATAEKGHEDQP